MSMVKICENIDTSLLKMRAQLWPELSEDEHRKELESFWPDDKFIVFQIGNEGFLEAYIRRYANGCEKMPVVFLEGIWVDPKSQRQGIGYQLLQALETWAKERGYDEIISDTDLENTSSQRAHTRWGFEEKERVVYYRKEI